MNLPTLGVRKPTSSSASIPKNVKILILPGFGNESGDYFLEQAPQGSLVASLQSKGWQEDQIRVLPLKRTDWLQVFLSGALDLQFWLADADATRPAFAWYLNRIADSIQDMTDSPDTKVILLGHSAGGWIARAALGFASLPDSNFAKRVDLNQVMGLVTLGAPHLPPPPQVMDMTRGALRITDQLFPGSYHQNQGIFYLTVIGNALKGVKQERKGPFEPTSPSGFAFNSYEAVCGVGDTVGDGVVPCSAGHLQDALQINLEGIFHSINAPDNWYGSISVIDSWHTPMMEQIAKASTADKKSDFSATLDKLFR